MSTATVRALPPSLAAIPVPDGVEVAYVDDSVTDPFDESVYYSGQVICVTGPGGEVSIEARGETVWFSTRTIRRAKDFRATFIDGVLPEDGDPVPGTDKFYEHLLTNWFDLFIATDDDDWGGLDYAMSSLRDALGEAYRLAGLEASA